MTIDYMGMRIAMLSMAAATMGTSALASPGSGITSTVLATGDLNEVINYNHDRIKFQTKDPTDVRVQELMFAPNANARTGWHHHPGIVIVTVAAGSVTAYDHNCQTKTYGKGSVFVEGHDTPMEVRSAGGATLYATYVAPNSTPRNFRIEDDAINCSAGLGFIEVPSK